MTEIPSRKTQDTTYAVSRLREAGCRDEQHDPTHNTVQRTCMNYLQFSSPRYVTPQGSNSDDARPLCPPCLRGDKAGTLSS
ncbi:MAG: hypothetical protein KatS3mg054_0507 [Chloroflexus sp.]|nr:MAG: hypothetical protein KatS3mg054_0507 [Chloroflexus sp.]GIV92182.1 MAG: hypothetical protein KatS3mg056_0891 [Chloroflexus sp.]